MLEASCEAAHGPAAGRPPPWLTLTWARFPANSSGFTAAASLEQGLAYITQYDLDRLRFMLAWKSLTDVYLGHWEQAAEAATEVLRSALRSTIGKFIALVSLGRLCTRQGNPEGQALLDAALELSQNMNSIDRLGPIRTARAEAAWFAGDLERTRAEARSIFDLALSRPQVWYAGELAFWLWKVGDAPRAS
jgi:hypothetical protein